MTASSLQKFYHGKKIFLTGHTGFKGSWLALWLSMMGARVYGSSLAAEKESLFNILQLGSKLDKSTIGDIRNFPELQKAMTEFQPEIVIHMAAQPLVRLSYHDPLTTYETNVIGTLNVFEAVRKFSKNTRAILNITTDKCYENREAHHNYNEEEPLGGYDPYSASKACAEILTSSHRRSFFAENGIALASARAGNVIGGGDFSADRIIPDIFRSVREGVAAELRAPNSIRPWQHVLEPLQGYLLLTKNLYEKGETFAKPYNFGPDSDAEQNVETLTKAFIHKLGAGSYKINADKNLHEAGILKLDNSRAKKELGWQPKLGFEENLEWTAEWYKSYLNGGDVKKFTSQQIGNFLSK